jgi:hypothetical protein
MNISLLIQFEEKQHERWSVQNIPWSQGHQPNGTDFISKR